MDNQDHTKKVKFFLDQVLMNSSQGYPKDVEDYLEVLRRNRITKPIIYVGVSSSSVCAGAQAVKKTIEEYIAERELGIDLIFVGRLGLCSDEPLVDFGFDCRAD